MIPIFLSRKQATTAAEEKARNEALRQEFELLKTKYDEQQQLTMSMMLFPRKWTIKYRH